MFAEQQWQLSLQHKSLILGRKSEKVSIQIIAKAFQIAHVRVQRVVFEFMIPGYK